MECQDVTEHIADYLAGSLPLDKLEALLTHASACAACNDKLTAAEERSQQLSGISSVAADLPAMRRRFDAVLAEYQDLFGDHPQNRRLPRCATCHFPGQSCSWICRRKFS